MRNLTRRILVTGATGFVGTHLINHLKELGFQRIIGLVHRRLPTPDARSSRVQMVQGDLRNPKRVAEVLKKVRPEWIFHLAGQASVAQSWQEPSITFQDNVIAQLNLLEVVRARRLNVRTLVACSSDEYGHVEQKELPLREENQLRPLSPYAVSKVTQDLMAYQYFRSYGMHIVRTRAFNHTGPGRPPLYAISNFAKQIAEIEQGSRLAVLHVGNLDARRDYLDVRDVVRAYVMALSAGQPGEVYNICSGRSQSMRKILQMLLLHTDKLIKIRQDPLRLRPSDLPVIYGDNGKFRRLTGWAPLIPFSKTLQDLLNYWRTEVAARRKSVVRQ
jgi:GDP-4-dehydro-6-deoxy-D-mannose reductase